MYRKITAIAVLSVATVVAAWAAVERGTFVLASGERKSGNIVYHGDKGENLINGFLNIGNDAGGPEFTFPVDQVIVIDFDGSAPSAAEKQAVPTDSGQLMVLRNGQTKKGRFVNMIGGDTLVWEREGGGEERHMIRDVARVYLNGQRAWTTYIRETPPAVASSSGGVSPAPAGTVAVSAKQGWTDTGITVRRGETYTFTTSGEVAIRGDDANAKAGPDGKPGERSQKYPVPVALGGALIGRIGDNRPFLIGTTSRPLPMTFNGRLFLGINDEAFDDNSGQFNVKIEKR